MNRKKNLMKKLLDNKIIKFNREKLVYELQ